MKKFLTISLMAMAIPAAFAAIPSGYYQSLGGKKTSDLKTAAGKLADGHTAITYGEDTWDAFRLTDVIIVDGREAWRDMYSNELVWVETGHSSLNIEHSVPKSWWKNADGKVDYTPAYCDLFHLNPSNPSANNQKSNWPLGIIASVSWTNGITNMGAPDAATGGGASKVFEPAEQFKGDFARAYFYVFSSYTGVSWTEESAWMYDMSALSYPTLKPWAIEMLLDWARQDPVDSYEMARNEAIYGLQGNRNPFIDIPDLCEYIWGDKEGVAFPTGTVAEPVPVDRPDAPTFSGNYNLTALNTYEGRWWDAFSLNIEATQGSVSEYRLDGGEWSSVPSAGIEIAASKDNGERHVVEVRSSWTINGLTLVSPVTTLTLTAKDPDVEDYKDAYWTLVTSQSKINTDTYYIVVSTNTFNIMSINAGSTSSNKYVYTAGTVNVTNNVVSSVPEEAAIVRFVEGVDMTNPDVYAPGQVAVSVNDIAARQVGYCYATAAKNMVLDAAKGVPVTVTVAEDGVASISFGAEIGTLQFNATSPRFVPYTSKQETVSLYIYDPDYTSSVDLPYADENLPVRYYDLNGRSLDGSHLPAGLCIRVQGAKAEKILVR